MEKIELNKPGYGTYAVLKGGKEIIKFNDNSDIATDKESNAIPVVPKGKSQPIEFVPRGRNNNMMYDIMKKIGHNVTVGSNIEFKNKVIYGDGVMVYRKYRDPNTGKIVKEEVLPEEYPEIFEFIENNDYSLIRHEIANDLAIFYDSYVEYLFDSNNPPKLVQIKSKEATCSRISKIDEKTGKSEWHGYSAEWHKGSPEDVIATPLLDRQSSLRDLKVRMGILPNKDGKNEIVKERNFIHNIRINTPGRFYYSRPYWWSVFASGWYDFSSAIPVYKKALIKNQMTLRYVIYIKDTFWDKLYKAKGLTTDEEKAQCREDFLKEMNDFLAGEENAGKAFVAEFRYDKIKGFEDKDIIISALTNQQIGGEYIEDSEEVSNTICYAMGVHPSIIGASPGKGKSINGTEARELFTIEQALMKMYQDATLEPLYFAKAINDWPKDIYFSITNCQLTTLDQGTGAVKNTGLTPETKE
ncbi:MAG: hypothetical protein KH897_03555 [Bacteroides sp.]|jgi:hypothetical protein|uniref:hypothetical protein n=1 Tax=Bacteroides sp. TaxID=29523 RepID=UPI0025B834AB|nr:hypothetical protein [Bacteroides sp.]MBS6237461.1 hypothetical protein [Bacteroides sp.]